MSLEAQLNKPRIHFGSLEEQLRAAGGPAADTSIEKGKSLDELDDIIATSSAMDTDDIPDIGERGRRAQAEHQAILDQFERKKMARSIAVPTDDRRVRVKLQRYGEPQTLFGEGPGERRDRLRELMVLRIQEYGQDIDDESDEDSESDGDASDEHDIDEEFYTYGEEGLLECRRWIAGYSLSRASKRLAAQRAELDVSLSQRKKMKKEWYTYLKTFSTMASQIGDDRPLTYCAFSPNSRLLATGSWSGLVKLWSIPHCTHLLTLKGHKEKVSSLAFHPRSTLSQSPDALNVVTTGMDGKVNLHSFTSDVPIAHLTGHEMRVARVAFHPSGRLIGTTSFDHTWRLWDSETTTELLLQEGQSREVYGIGFQCDGSLVATGGSDAIGRVWDIRTGRSIMVLQGHVKGILSLDWSSNGHILATGSEDNTIRIWDVRQAACSYTIPAHTNLVTQVRFWSAGDGFDSEGAGDGWVFTERDGRFDDGMDEDVDGDEDGESDDDEDGGRRGDVDVGEESSLRRQVLSGGHLVSSSFDGTCKIFTEGDWKPIKSLAGLEGKVVGCDVSRDGKYIATASYDRTFKLYSAS